MLTTWSGLTRLARKHDYATQLTDEKKRNNDALVGAPYLTIPAWIPIANFMSAACGSFA